MVATQMSPPQHVGDMASSDKLITKFKKMNTYLRKWINETYPLMGKDIEELDHYDLQKFADWMEEQLAISRVSCSLPSKDDISSLGYNNAVNGRYNYRRVLRDKEQDVYYSGWMDCVDFLNK